MPERFELTGIDHVQVAMPPGGEADARRFYGQLLGLVEVDKPAALAPRGGCWFAGASGRVHVHLGVEAEFRPALKAHPAFTVDDLGAMRRRLRDSGVAIVEDNSLSGVERFYAADPFGNRIEFIAAEASGFTSRGWRQT